MWSFSQLAYREHSHSPWQETNSSMTFTAVCVCSQTHLKRQCDISDIPSFAGGPFNMAEMNKATVHASERVSARDMIQTQFEGDEDLSLMTDKDVAKMKKKAEKDERAARAALAAHQVRPAYLCIITNTCLPAEQLHETVLVLDSGFFFLFFSPFLSLEPRISSLTQNAFVCRGNDGYFF